MCAYVALQQPGPAEGLTTGVAAAALCVCPHVLTESRRTEVHLAAVRAPARAPAYALVTLSVGRSD